MSKTITTILVCCVAICLFGNMNSSAASPQPLLNYSGKDRFEVISSSYHLVVDLSEASIVVFNGEHSDTIFYLYSFDVEHDGVVYQADFQTYKPDLHVLRMGAWMTELHIENVVFSHGQNNLGGLGELSIFCYPDEVFFALDYICNAQEWIVRDEGKYVYPARPGFRNCEGISAGKLSFSFGFSSSISFPAVEPSAEPIIAEQTALIVCPTVPEQHSFLSSDGHRVMVERTVDSSWAPDDIHEVGAAILFGEDHQEVEDRYRSIIYPLSADNFIFDLHYGVFLSYFRRAGTYRIGGRGTPTPNPSPGYVGGSRLTIQNDVRNRRIYIDQVDNWGGIAGGIVTDSQKMPLPLHVQFYLNYPEKSSLGERPGAHMIFPLELPSGSSKTLRAHTLFNQLTHRDLIYLNSLEANSHASPGIFQVSVNRHETHSTRQDPFIITDFRPHPNDVKGRSASASATSFLRYVDQTGTEVLLRSNFYEMIETGPGLIEYKLDLESQDGKVRGNGHIFQFANSDHTRVFCEVELHFEDDVQLSASADVPINFMRFDVGNPMVFRNFAYMAADGNTQLGSLTNAGPGTIHTHGGHMHNPFFFSMFKATNYGGDPDLTISDRSGNPAMIVTEWEANINGEEVSPAAYAFASGAVNNYHRTLAVIPAKNFTSIEKGSSIRFTLMLITGGDGTTDERFAEKEYECWNNLGVYARTGVVEATHPIQIRASENVVDFDISGGCNRVAVKIGGFSSLQGLWAYVLTDSGYEKTYGGNQSDAWYNTWQSVDGSYGVTFLVDIPEGDEVVRVRASSMQPGDEFFETGLPQAPWNEGRFLLYPNPAKHWVQIEHDAPFGLYVYDIRGSLVKSIQLPGSVRLPLSLSSGFYFFHLVSDIDGVVNVQKVLLIQDQ